MKNAFFTLVLCILGYLVYDFNNTINAQRDVIKKLQADINSKDTESVVAKPELHQGRFLVIPKHLICPLCEGEGRLMLRRSIQGTLTDISSTCPLCIGNGKRTIEMPKSAKICPDCGGFGRRILVDGTLEKGRNSSNPNELRPSSRIKDGVFADTPKTTGCSRCLSRGYILQPGLESN